MRLLPVLATVVVAAVLPATAVAKPRPLSVPAQQLHAAFACAAPLKGAAHTPVLLVPGTGEDPDFFNWNYEPALTKLGIPYCTITLPDHGTSDIQVAAEYVVSAIRRMHARTGGRIDIIGHSQGGMVPRWALRFWPDTRAMVDDLVGLAASNHGTTSARAVCNTGCSAATWQQRDDSQFIAALNASLETWRGISYTSVFTHFDEIVTPNQDAQTGSTALRTGAGQRANIAVQDICPNDTADHLQLGSSDAVGYALAIDALTHPGPADAKRIPPTTCLQPAQPGVNPATGVADATASYTKVGQQFNSGKILSAEPPLACYVNRTCVKPALTVTVRPQRLRAGRRARVRVRVRRADGHAVRGARVRFGGRTKHTGRHGRAVLRVRFAHAGRRSVRVHKAGFASRTIHVRVARRR
jgi:triacylglycerol esterase/lipase EstA (alpha/beta hydrolase family)